ncbi:MAG: flagellar hook-associated protein FlgL [Nitrospinae bacterium]|nr:flagellar hook-associated protein FlgL [Nitrospinota bacterium]
MVTRVTNQIMQNNALNNIFRLTEDLEKAQNDISSGKKISKPSDDPAGIRDALGFRSTIAQTDQFIRNIDFNQLLLASGDNALNAIGVSLTRAKELALNQLNGVSTDQTRQFAANEIDKLLSLVLQEANASVKGQYIFAGSKIKTQPFSVSASGEVSYAGNTENFQVETAKGFKTDMTLPGSQVLATDLNPAVTSATLLSSLNGGAGVPAGSFVIADRAGNSATIAVTAGMTAGNLLSAINAAGTNVTASINADKNGLLLTDSSSVIRQALTVSEVGGGATARKLGILGQRDGNLAGSDVDPILTASAALSQLNGGTGLTLTAINIVNGSASGTVTLSSAATLGDVVNAINNAGLNVTASVNSQGNSLRVVSNNSATAAVVSESGTGTSARDLGIGGGRNVLNTLATLKAALSKNDQQGILASIGNLDAGLQNINEGRATLGAAQRTVLDTRDIHDKDIVDFTQQKAAVEDTDIVRRASDFALLQTALEAALNVTSRVIQPSLLDFLR